MPLFISYSHADKAFVDHLAAELASRRRHVWMDHWELNVGDSLLAKVQEAITEASALIVVLSPASVSSAWCQKELNAGLIRELDEKRVLVLPVLVADCQIPIFLKEKRYADFRHSFSEGLKGFLEATATVSSQTAGRSSNERFHHDWAVDWAAKEHEIRLSITCASFYHALPFSVLCQVEIVGCQTAARQYLAYEKADLAPIGRALILTTYLEAVGPDKLQARISGDDVAKQELSLRFTNPSMHYSVVVSCRRLGDDSGKDLLYDYGTILQIARDTLLKRCRTPTLHELIAISRGQFRPKGTRPVPKTKRP